MAQYVLTILGGGITTVSAAACQLSATSIPCQMVILHGISTNASPNFVADSTVNKATTARVGIPVYAGSTSVPVTIYTTDVSNLYINGTSTEAVSWVYFGLTVP